MTPHSTRSEIEKLTTNLLITGLAIDSNPSVIEFPSKNLRTVTWARCMPSTDVVFATVDEYQWLVQNRQFNSILLDGSLLQISYTFRRNDLIEHRLCFYPCPVHLEPEEWKLYQEAGLGLLEIFEDLSLEEFQNHLRLQSPVRFDFDLDSAMEDHPASHLHLLREDCRIPVFAPLSIGRFIQFVFRHFYPEQWKSHGFLREWSHEKFNTTLTDKQRKQLHLACAEP